MEFSQVVDTHILTLHEIVTGCRNSHTHIRLHFKNLDNRKALLGEDPATSPQKIDPHIKPSKPYTPNRQKPKKN